MRRRAPWFRASSCSSSSTAYSPSSISCSTSDSTLSDRHVDAAVEPIIKVRNLTVGYRDVVLLERVSFDVRRGEVFVILGGSGSGKSTLLKHMIGLLEPNSGSAVIDGDDIITASGERRRAILRKIG